MMMRAAAAEPTRRALLLLLPLAAALASCRAAEEVSAGETHRQGQGESGEDAHGGIAPHMPDELLQLTGLESDAYVDTFLPIDAVHRAGRPHRGVWLFVVDADRRVLMLHRSGRMVTCPNSWSSVGEHNQPGEGYLEAAKRGLKEELGISWDAGVTSAFELEPRPSLLDIVYLNPDGGVHRHDVQWTRSFVVELAAGVVAGAYTRSQFRST